MSRLLPERLSLGFPLALIDQANAAAAILDPDTGGDQTFPSVALHVLDGVAYTAASLPLWTIDESESPELLAAGFNDYAAVIRSRNPAIWGFVLESLAHQRGREYQLTGEQLSELCATMRCDDELNPVESLDEE